jgi:uncharacterized protein (DUF2384 family)
VSTRFRKASDRPRLTPIEAERQGRAARLAFEALPEPGAAIAFLNTHHDGLGGRPIDLAVASDEGLTAIAAALGKPAGSSALPG